MLKYIKRNPVNIAFAIGLVGCLALSSKNISENLSTVASLRKVTTFNAQKNLELEASQQSGSEQAAIAIERYKNGCLLLPNTLVQGEPVLNSANKSLPRGTFVCDSIGNTGKLVPRDFDGDGIYVSVVAEIAYTGDKKVIQDSLAANQPIRIHQ